MTFDPDAQIVYRGVDALGALVEWGSFRIVAGGALGSGGVDVTEVLGAPTRVGGYQLLQPGGYGPADFEFPTITTQNLFDFPWINKGTEIRIERVNDLDEVIGVQWPGAAELVPYLWRGFISHRRPTSSENGTQIHCDGYFVGRLAALIHHAGLWYQQKQISSWIYDALLRAGIESEPMFGEGIEIEEIDTRDIRGTELSYIEEVLARTLQADGTSLTIAPSGEILEQRWKDLSTVHFSAFEGASGHTLLVEDDLLEEPTTIYGHGREPATEDDEEVLLWLNRKDPGLNQGEAPPFPGTLSPGESSDAVNTLQRKLVGMNYLSRRDAVGGFNDETEDAVKALQEDAGLAQTGIVNEATWDALWDVADTGFSLRQSFRRPMAELEEVRKWNYSSNGFKIEPNPTYNADRIEVSIDQDAGVQKKAKFRRWAKRHLAQIHENGPVWVGTLELESDVIVGDHGHGSAPEGIMSRLDLVPGMNVNVRNFGADGSTKFHVSTIDVGSDLNVTCKVDTKGRDALAVMQIIEANRESQINQGRQWLNARRATDPNAGAIEVTEGCGEIYNTMNIPADTWYEFPVPMGQFGHVRRFELQTFKTKGEFVCAVAAKEMGASFYETKVGDPFDNNTPVQSLTLTDGGSGYTSAPTVTISGGGGQGAKAVAEIEGGAVVELRLTQRGRGYTSTPSVSFSGGGGSGASATANLGGTGSARWTDGLTEEIDKQRLIVAAIGDFEQPGGYAPGNKVHFETGEPSGDPITGLVIDSGGFPYWTFDQPVLWVAIRAKTACKLKPQRVMMPALEANL